MNETDVIFLVCDVSKPDTMIAELTDWSKRVKENAKQNPVICVLANKIDLVDSEKLEGIKKKIEVFTKENNFKLPMLTHSFCTKMRIHLGRHIENIKKLWNSLNSNYKNCMIMLKR